MNNPPPPPTPQPPTGTCEKVSDFFDAAALLSLVALVLLCGIGILVGLVGSMVINDGIDSRALQDPLISYMAGAFKLCMIAALGSCVISAIAGASSFILRRRKV